MRRRHFAPALRVGTTGAFAALALAAHLLAGERLTDEQPAGGPQPHEAPDWSAVRDVLERRCLECHGGEARQSGFALADATTFAEGGGRGAVIDDRELAASRLLEVIEYADPELAMPPSGALPASERDLLRAWVLAGAPWPTDASGRLADPGLFAAEPGIDFEAGADWWAYRPLAAPKFPVPTDPDWRTSDIDGFVAAELEARGVEPAPLAAPTTLLRRATFDLTGLPPTPDERRAFEDDVDRRGADAAFAALVDRLLDSRAHAEHWARRWLDLVRYAETNGYERDSQKPNMWRYRDWVVRAIENDLPYDRFVVAQLAGEEEARLPRDGAVPHELSDAALATGYYRLVTWDDEPSDRLQARWDEVADVVDTTGQVFLGTTMGCCRCHDHKADPIAQSDYYAFTAFFNNVEGFRYDGERLVADPPGPGVLTTEERDARLAEVTELLEAEAEASGALEVTWEEPVTLVPDARTAAHRWRYRQLDAIDADPDGWQVPGYDDGAWPEGPAGFGDPSTPGSIVGTRWFTPRILARTTFALDQVPRSLVLSIHQDDDAVVYLNGVPVARFEGYVTQYVELELGPEALAALVVGRNVLAVSCLQDFGGRYLDVGLRSGTLAEADSTARIARNLAERSGDPAFARTRELWEQRESLLAAAVAAPYPAQVVREHGGTAPVQHVFGRGSAHAPGDEVAPHLPTVLGFAATSIEPPLPSPDPSAPSTGRRLALANWLVTKGAFLTARVEANRLWQALFGRGLCRTAGDFGRLGDLPTHPELLDHLAQRLIDSGWDREAVVREILSSRTYRLASVGPEDSLAADPRNDLFWRHDPRRVTAEEFRDAVLAVSGRLVDEAFGPWVYPPMDPAVLATASRPDEAWGESLPDQADRRSLYVHTKRSLRLPLLEAFDQPSPDLPCPERFPTSVPTQALMTLNGSFAREAATDFARALLDATDDERAQVAQGLERAFARAPHPGEVERQLAFLDRLTERGFGRAEALAIWCLGLFNLNEFSTVD
ncbi:Planctomycete cytochrome C [Planctomycetes bacterium Pla163]|uniref:Planctomycete cytochrome C n=1 Tax=Rohdeia mirabilis TaxID=2528008 RepID=A0A518D2H9_9BACT|nr:Planctomycete cytochrome C [Planctomycetes bacterium Pla163]